MLEAHEALGKFMKDINPMNAVALFLVVGKLRPNSTTVLAGWTFVWFFLVSLLQLTLQPVPPAPGAEVGPAMASYFASLAVMLPIGLISWALPFAAWMRLLTTGQGNGLIPFRFGAEEFWALAVLLALFATYLVAMVVLSVIAVVLVSLVPPLAFLGIFVVPAVTVAVVYIGLRLTPAAALSAMTHRFAITATWQAMKGRIGSVLMAWLVVVAAMIAASIVMMALGLVIPSFNLQQEMMQMLTGGPRPGLAQLLPFAFVNMVLSLPVTLMGYSVTAYYAMAISGRDDGWMRAIAEAEAQAEGGVG
jgi:hypothetical protein